jgi:hypothetical protein
MLKATISRTRTTTRSAPVIAVIGALGLVAACGSSGGSGSAPTVSPARTTSPNTSISAPTTTIGGVVGVDACSLVTAAEASAAVKEPVTRAATSTAAHCEFAGQGTDTIVAIDVRPTTPTEFASKCRAEDTAIPNTGDAACGGPKFVILRKGNVEVDFTARTILGAGQVMMDFATLAKTVVTRL